MFLKPLKILQPIARSISYWTSIAIASIGETPIEQLQKHKLCTNEPYATPLAETVSSWFQRPSGAFEAVYWPRVITDMIALAKGPGSSDTTWTMNTYIHLEVSIETEFVDEMACKFN